MSRARIFALTACALLPATAGAEEHRRLDVGTGALLTGVRALSNSPLPSSAPAWNQHLVVGASYWLASPWWASWYLVPGFVMAPFPRKETDTGYQVSVMAFSLPVARVFGALDVKLGPGLLLTRVSGTEGGMITLENGSSTFDFYRPDGSSTARTMFLELGAGVSYWRLRLDVDTLWSGLLSSRRSAGIMARLSASFF